MLYTKAEDGHKMEDIGNHFTVTYTICEPGLAAAGCLRASARSCDAQHGCAGDTYPAQETT